MGTQVAITRRDTVLGATTLAAASALGGLPLRSPAQVQPLSGNPKMATNIPPANTTPNQLETWLGMLRFFDGFPDDATVETVYENLDYQRGVQAFLTAMPVASLVARRKGIRLFCPDNQTVIIFESLADSRAIALTGNTDTVYGFAWLDLKDGPVVIECPASTLGFVDDFWFHYRLRRGARYESQYEREPHRIWDMRWRLRDRLEERLGRKWPGGLEHFPLACALTQPNPAGLGQVQCPRSAAQGLAVLYTRIYADCSHADIAYTVISKK